MFDELSIISKSHDDLGNVIGRNASEINILNAGNDIIKRMNVLIAYFGNM